MGRKGGGIAVGRAAAQATLNRRAKDGVDTATQPAYVPNATAGDYQFTRTIGSTVRCRSPAGSTRAT